MNRVMGRNTIAAAVLIAVGVVGLRAAPAQETWGATGASTGGSRSSSAQSAGHASGAISSGGSSSWTAGKQSFTYPVQSGGVWHDNAEFSGSSEPSSRGSAPGMHASGRSLRPAGLRPAPSAGSVTAHGKTQVAHISGGQGPSGGSRAGIAKSAHGGLPGRTGMKSSTAASRSRSGSRGSGMTGFSAGKGEGSGLSSKTPSTNPLK
jgi:hypothetical protein